MATDYTLADLIDIPRLQELLDSLDKVYNLPSAIIDIEGKVLTATAWQDICTTFHRTTPQTERLCIESDRKIFSEAEKRPPHVIYQCPHGLIDTVTPIIIEGKHYGNAFTGQLFLEAPDEGRFREQARRYGFDEEAYMAALRKVPVISEERLKQNLYIVANLAVMLAEFGLRQKRQLEAEKKIKASELWFREIFEGAPDAIFIADANTGIIINANNQAAALLQKNTEEIIGQHQSAFHPADYREQIRAFFHEHVVEADTARPIESLIVRADGTTVPVEIMSHTFEMEDRFVVMGTFRDITERKQAEQRIQNSLREKEILLKEVHHRVKNNMAVISSLLSLQATYFPDEKYQTMIMESKSRIRAMALVHEKLYQSENLVDISVGEYLEALVTDIRLAFMVKTPVAIILDVERIFLDIDTLIPCGLIINELLTNSFRHAFNGIEEPRIVIELKQPEKETVLTLADNGTGFPAGINPAASPGLGLRLVTGLVGQINGKAQFMSDGGVSFRLTFPRKIEFAKA